MFCMKTVDPISLFISYLFYLFDFCRPQLRICSLKKNRFVMSFRPVNDLCKHRHSYCTSSKRCMPVKMRAKSSLTIIEMKRVKLVYSYKCIPLLDKIVPFTEVVTSSSCMRSIKTESQRKILKISLIELCQIINQISEFTPLSCGNLEEEQRFIARFSIGADDIFNIFSHITICIFHIFKPFSFTHMDINRFKSCMVSYFKVMQDTFDI